MDAIVVKVAATCTVDVKKSMVNVHLFVDVLVVRMVR